MRIDRKFLFGSGFRSRVVWVLAWFLVQAAALPLAAREDPSQPSTSRTARAEAIRAIPFERLDAAAQAKVNAVVHEAGVYRRLPIQVIDCDPNLYLFLVRHPEVVVDIWKLMGVTEMSLERTGEVSFRASDGVGTVGTLEFLYGDHQTHLIYSEGTYSGPLTPRPIAARCLLVLQSGFIKQPDGRYLVTNRLDAFVNVDHVGVDLLARTFQGIFGRTADSNFGETAYFVSKLSRTAESNAEGISRMSERLAGLRPAIRQEFVEHADQVALRAAARAEALERLQRQSQVTRGQNSPPR